MAETIVIRRYEPRDRDAVRRICCDTADRGEPVENFFRDREFIADLVTRYYTDFEPPSSWVAEDAGQVVGYLNGCLDSRRCQRLLAWRIGPLAVIKAIVRGALGRAETWRWLRALARTAWQGGGPSRVPLEQYPAHLHINVQRGSRAQGVGPRLMERFFEQVRAAHLAGVHATVRGDNEGGCHFFERMGFVALSRHPLAMPGHGPTRVIDTVVYGKKLTD